MTNANETSPGQAVPRLPNAEEQQLLAAWLCDQGHDEEDAPSVVQSAYVAVFDDYCTGSPGYCGKVLSVVWDGAPSFFDVFIWENGTMERSGRDYDAKECDRCGGNGGTLCVDCWRTWSNRS